MSEEFSFFDGVDDIEDVSNDPFFMPDDMYRWRIVEATVSPTKAGDKTGLKIKLQCAEGPFKGNIQWAPWRRIPFQADADFAELLSSDDDSVKSDAVNAMRKLQAQLRKDFEAYGFGADELKSLNLKDTTPFIGREVMGRVRNQTNDVDENERKIIGLYKVDEVSGEDGIGGFGQFVSDGVTSFASEPDPWAEDKPEAAKRTTSRKAAKPAEKNDIEY
jgi:hypothetical protein